ncbi:MAG: Gfo/Idh/MocA family protein [Verrucomicrobiaceae bacterium]
MIHSVPSRREALSLSTKAILASTLGLQSSWADVRENSDPRPLGLAILGLGDYATTRIAPALTKTRHVKLTGLITGSPDKLPGWQGKYKIPDENVYTYDDLEKIADNKDIDVVYVITPTGTHADFTIRALEAGKHVICEKPMAPTVAECDRMIEAAKKANRMLQIGYRLYWDPYHTRLITAMRDKEFGDWTALESGFGYSINKNSIHLPHIAWRIGKELGIAGALYDVGVYAIQGAFYATQIHPVRVTATSSTDRPDVFTEVPENWEWELEYADGRKSKHMASYNRNGNNLHVQTEEGKLHIDSAYNYEGQTGETPLGPMDFEQVFQQALQLDAQALAIHKRASNVTPGEMGRRDIRVVNAVMEAAATGKPVEFSKFEY